MLNILELSAEDRRTVFRNTAQYMGVHEAIIEKDYWVCLVLEHLFSKSHYKKHIAFKGGTCLSKCFGIISRFSEDIDLILDWRLLGYGYNEPWEVRSKTKQDAFNKTINRKAEIFIAEKFLSVFINEFSETIGEIVNAMIDVTEPQTLLFYYPQFQSSESLQHSIRLEIGALAAWTPSENKTVTPYIFERYPELAQDSATIVVASSAERTFWEKVTILHHEANRPDHLEMPLRYSRHYYDLFCMKTKGYVESSLKQIDLLEKVATFKMRFYPRKWARYDEAFPGSIKLTPPKSRFVGLQKDYESMAEMFFEKQPSFSELMDVIETIEKEINKDVPKVM